MSQKEIKTPSAAKVRDTSLKCMSKLAGTSGSKLVLRSLTESILNPASEAFIADQIEEDYCWSFNTMSKNSAHIPDGPAEQKAAILNLFEVDDLVQISGGFSKPSHSAWLPKAVIKGPMSCFANAVSPFVLSMGALAHDGVVPLHRRFLVITTDPFSENASVLNWLASEFGMKLRAVTSSLDGVHGWFDPVDSLLELQLSIYLPFHRLGSRESFEGTQRLLLPGAAPYVNLIYLAR